MARKRKRSKSRRSSSSSALAVRRAAPAARHHSPRTIVVAAPKRRSAVRRAAGAVAGSQDRAILIGGLASLALGYAEYKGVKIPHFGTIGEAGTLAIAAYAAKRLGLVHGALARDAGYVAASMAGVALYKIGQNGLSLSAEHAAHGEYPAQYDVR